MLPDALTRVPADALPVITTALTPSRFPTASACALCTAPASRRRSAPTATAAHRQLSTRARAMPPSAAPSLSARHRSRCGHFFPSNDNGVRAATPPAACNATSVRMCRPRSSAETLLARTCDHVSSPCRMFVRRTRRATWRVLLWAVSRCRGVGEDEPVLGRSWYPNRATGRRAEHDRDYRTDGNQLAPRPARSRLPFSTSAGPAAGRCRH